MFVLLSQYAHAQIPFEVMVGHRQTQYYAFIQKNIDSSGQWNIFSQSFYSVHYTDVSLNAINIEGQITYQISDWFGISAGGGFDGNGFVPTIGLSVEYINEKQDFSATAFPTIQITKPLALDVFALINFSPQFSHQWGLFSQAILGANVGTQYNSSLQWIRLGLNYERKFQFGLAADFIQIPQEQFFSDNFGFFLRYQIE